MLHNMSLNKKCHSHLANGVIINFITSVYQTEFYKTYGSRAESDAQRRTIKTILHTLTRLASDSPTLGAELLEQWHLPDLLRQSLALKPSSPQQHLDSSYGGDISHLARQLLGVHRQEQQERRRYEQHLEQIRTVSKDTRYSLERQHYINLESLLDDVQLLKRHTLITLRLIFERLVRVLVISIEQSQCDLLLRANINMVATLMNIDYDGFASLSDAFIQNEAVRTLLVVVLDHKQSSVRALALRALATLCCAPQAINQLGSCGGIEIVRDILQVESAGERGAIERREAVSLLAQITAAWHGPEHRVPGLRDCSESLVAGLAALLQPECCTQTLLLCAAALNNLSRMEATSHYSIMSNEAIFRLIDTLEHQSCGTSVFLYVSI